MTRHEVEKEKGKAVGKMKYYYNDKLIRTSKTREYKYALIGIDGKGNFKVWACSANKENLNRKKAELIKESYNGSVKFMLDCNSGKFKHNSLYQEHYTEVEVEEARNKHNKFCDLLQVVELEIRAG